MSIEVWPPVAPHELALKIEETQVRLSVCLSICLHTSTHLALATSKCARIQR